MFTQRQLTILIEMLENNHLKLGEADDIAYIGYIIRHLKESLKLVFPGGEYSLDPTLAKDYTFFKFINMELEWLSNNEQCSQEIIDTCEILFETYMPNPDIFTTYAIQKEII